jgi:hypothetical protein
MICVGGAVAILDSPLVAQPNDPDARRSTTTTSAHDLSAMARSFPPNGELRDAAVFRSKRPSGVAAFYGRWISKSCNARRRA